MSQTVCDVTSSNVPRLALHEQKMWDRERWVGTPQGWKLYGLTVKSLSRSMHFFNFKHKWTYRKLHTGLNAVTMASMQLHRGVHKFVRVHGDVV